MHAHLTGVLITQPPVVAPDVPVHDVEPVTEWRVNPAIRRDPADLDWHVVVPVGTSWKAWRWFTLVHVSLFPMHTGVAIADRRHSCQSGAAPRAARGPRPEAQRAGLGYRPSMDLSSASFATASSYFAICSLVSITSPSAGALPS